MKNNQITETMIQLIDKRVQKYISTMNVVTQYAGVVTGKLGENSYKVRLAGSENNFTFGNKTNQDLNIGDSVYIQTIGNDLNTGIIIASFKPYINNIQAYPVGSLYFSIYDIYPGNLFGGNWERIKDRFLLGVGDIYSSPEAQGGESTHSLSIDEIPSHSHTANKFVLNNFDNPFTVAAGTTATLSTGTGSTKVGLTGGGEPHNNMPPYITVFMWKRIG